MDISVTVGCNVDTGMTARLYDVSLTACISYSTLRNRRPLDRAHTRDKVKEGFAGTAGSDAWELIPFWSFEPATVKPV